MWFVNSRETFFCGKFTYSNYVINYGEGKDGGLEAWWSHGQASQRPSKTQISVKCSPPHLNSFWTHNKPITGIFSTRVADHLSHKLSFTSCIVEVLYNNYSLIVEDHDTSGTILSLTELIVVQKHSIEVWSTYFLCLLVCGTDLCFCMLWRLAGADLQLTAFQSGLVNQDVQFHVLWYQPPYFLVQDLKSSHQCRLRTELWRDVTWHSKVQFNSVLRVRRVKHTLQLLYYSPGVGLHIHGPGFIYQLCRSPPWLDVFGHHWRPF